ncbi:uncharacterized protein C8A04DRAFT_34642 [Dichotomopilus funicola]|uniref:Atos-like conserved domain-containing protein n=1 Tax=Dichotomopilus funicola TaxID=1934379 RepID=A0AAN6V9Z5_9PEZI|nr:hypothetical protein C8A04DRAFT_34642 [Dichotomopilus funicola]
MPMFNEDDMARKGSHDLDSQRPGASPIPIQTPPGAGRWNSRRLSEESIRTELCEGPLLDSPPRPETPQEAVSRAVSDRAELIERLKRGESPTWVPNRHLESLFHHQNKASSPPRTPHSTRSESPGLLPAPTISPEKQDAVSDQQAIGSPSHEGLNIERPRSALHSGDFTPVDVSPGSGDTGHAVLPGAESHFGPSHSVWTGTSPPRDYSPFSFPPVTADYRREAFKSGPSSLSSSLSSSFVYQPPTSPLVQSQSNEELDLTVPLNSFNIDANSPRNARRHTLNFGHPNLANTTPGGGMQTPFRRESTIPYQAHQPRRSLNSTPNNSITGASPQTPAFPRPRRPSIGSEASPLHHASMVGSYEESILRGRMSTTPSKPLEFTARIGVLGLGKCKASLRCPAHVTLPFSAVFYNYGSTTLGGVKVEDGPSPYVGQIDLENRLPDSEEGQRTKRKMQSRYQDLKGPTEDAISGRETSPAELSGGDGNSKTSRSKRTSRTLKAPPGGGYRIPEKGQIQIIIKNQNKTAVKLFLIPYDLAGMEPGTKTFIRQRSYSTGPIIETEVSKDAPVASSDRPTLRYLVHLHICCPSKGRHYLYKSIRVVFANRVPDDKERLRNEVTYPDPRFTPYKPIRAMHPPLGSGHTLMGGGGSPSAAALAADRSSRRRSLGFPHGQAQTHLQPYQQHQPQFSPPRPQQYTEQKETYDKLSRGDAGYGGYRNHHTVNNNNLTKIPDDTNGPHNELNTNTNASLATDTTAPGTAAGGGSNTATEGLLSQRLRSLGVQHPA